MPYVNVPNDLSKIKTKIAFKLTRRQLICFGGAAAVGIPVYLLTRHALGGTGAVSYTHLDVYKRQPERLDCRPEGEKSRPAGSLAGIEGTHPAGAAVALLNACAPAVNAPEPVFPIPEKKQVEMCIRDRPSHSG